MAVGHQYLITLALCALSVIPAAGQRISNQQLPVVALGRGGTGYAAADLNALKTYLGIGTGGGTWGSIAGTLANQTDLSAALAGKAPLNGAGATGTWPISIYGNAGTATTATGLSATEGGTIGSISYTNATGWQFTDDNPNMSGYTFNGGPVFGNFIGMFSGNADTATMAGGLWDGYTASGISADASGWVSTADIKAPHFRGSGAYLTELPAQTNIPTYYITSGVFDSARLGAGSGDAAAVLGMNGTGWIKFFQNASAGDPMGPGSPTTTLTAAIASFGTNLQVASTAGYPPTGALKIDNEYVGYSSIPDGTHFTLNFRAYVGSTSASHALGATVYYAPRYAAFTYLASAFGATDTVLNVTSTVGFPTSGWMLIGTELFYYAKIVNATQFGGLIRPCPVSHANGTAVMPDCRGTETYAPMFGPGTFVANVATVPALSVVNSTASPTADLVDVWANGAIVASIGPGGAITAPSFTGAVAGNASTATTAAGVTMAGGASGQFLGWTTGGVATWQTPSGSGGGTWGSIAGTLSDQTDLSTALAGKLGLHATADAATTATSAATAANATRADTAGGLATYSGTELLGSLTWDGTRYTGSRVGVAESALGLSATDGGNIGTATYSSAGGWQFAGGVVSGSFVGNLAGNANTVTNGVYTTGAGVVYLAPNGSAAALTSFPTLNQDTTGSAAKLGSITGIPVCSAGTPTAVIWPSGILKGANTTATPVAATAGTDYVVPSGSVTGSSGSVALTAAPGADHTTSGTTIQLVAAQAQAIGDVCCINASGQATLAKADAIANASAVVMVADATIGSGATGNYLVMGVARDDTWNWTVGGTVYLSTTGTTGNTLTQTAPSAANNVIQVIGVAIHADRMLFNPSLVQVEHN
jgi:hypothetical protein